MQKTEMETVKERYPGAGANCETKTKARTDTKSPTKKKTTEGRELETKLSRKTRTRGRQKLQPKLEEMKKDKNKETTEGTEGRERTSWGNRTRRVPWEQRNGNSELMTVTEKWTQGERSHYVGKHRYELRYGPDMQEVVCHYCGESLNATGKLSIRMKIQPLKGGWNAETRHRLIPEDTPSD